MNPPIRSPAIAARLTSGQPMKFLVLAIVVAMTAACTTAATYEVVDAGIDNDTIMSSPHLGSQTEREAIAVLKAHPTGAAGPALDLLYSKLPGYPRDVIADEIEGVVEITYTIDVTGKVTDIHVLSSPDPRLSAECVAAISQWRFRPPMEGGAAVRVKARQRFPFKLG